MLPPKKDNYGVDSCSIIALTSSTPTTLVIAESTGRLHHCLITETAAEDSVHPQWTIYVMETIELDLGLTIDPTEKSYVCPVFLKRDPTNETRYFAYHNAGLHGVTMKFLSALATFVEDSPADDTAEALELNEASQAEYLVCTKMAGVDKANVVLGLAFLQSPPVLVLYLNSGQVISLDLITKSGVLDQFMERSQKNVQNSAKAAHYLSATKSLIAASADSTHKPKTGAKPMPQPLLNLDKSTNLGAAENMSVLQNYIATFKENYFQRLDAIRRELEKHVNLLTATKGQQVLEIKNLQAECDLIRDNAENLAVKYEDICERQQEFTKRAQEVLRLANLHLPKNTSSEREFVERITAISGKTKSLANQLITVRAKMDQFKQHGDVQDKAKRNQPHQQRIVLPAKREQIIMEILGDA